MAQKKAVAGKLGISIRRVDGILNRNKVKIARIYKSKYSEEVTREIIKDFLELKLDGAGICKKHQISQSQLSRILKVRGVSSPERLKKFSYNIKEKRGGEQSNNIFWEKKYGLEIASQKAERNRKSRLGKASGRNNPMHGRPSPQGSGNGWKGWLNNIFFRSLREAAFMIYMIENKLEWINGEHFRIPYEFNGVERNYFPDFLIGNKLYEIKPVRLHHTPNIIAKKIAAEKFCEEKGWTYSLIDFKIDFDKIYDFYIKGMIKFSGDYENRFLDYCSIKGKFIMY